MGANLITSLQEIKDFRASQGRRYPLWLILLLIVMGTISGCRSYYAVEDFGARHYEAVSKQIGLKITRLPSDTTFRRILQKLDFQALAQRFEQWANTNFAPEPGEWVVSLTLLERLIGHFTSCSSSRMKPLTPKRSLKN